MREEELRIILGAMGVMPGRTNRKGWMQFPCPLAPWTHANGHDSSPSAAALASDTGKSSFVCKACHNKGPVAKLARLMADYSEDNRYRALILQADRADSQAQIDVGFGDFEQIPQEAPRPAPLDELAYADIYPPAASNEDAMAYLAGRGISPETTEKLGLLYDDGTRYDEETGQVYFNRQRRVVFPVRGPQGLWGFTGRAIDPGVKLKVRDYLGLPKEYAILGEDRWREGYPKLIVEGLFAYAWLVELGIEELADVGALLGSAMTPYKAEKVVHADSPTYLLLDNDPGGEIGLFGTPTPGGGRETNGAVHYLGGHVPLFVPMWPEGKDDPDQLTREEVELMLRETTPYAADDNTFDKVFETWV